MEIRVRDVVIGVAMFILIMLCMNAFMLAVYQPLENLVYALVEYLFGIQSRWLAAVVILLLSTAILILLGVRLPFVKR